MYYNNTVAVVEMLFDAVAIVFVSAEEEVEERRWSIVLWADGSSKFDLGL